MVLDRYRDLGLLITRLGFGLGFFWFHGLPKLRGGPARWLGTGEILASFGIGFGAEWWGLAAALSEAVGGILIALGFLFRPAVLAILTVMVVASVGHIVTGEGSPGHSLKNAFLFAGLVLIGPGRYSLDSLLQERRKGTPVRSPTPDLE